MIQPLQDIDCTAFGDYDAIALHVKWPARFRRIIIDCQCALAVECSKNAECARTFGDAARKCDIDFIQQQLLRAGDNAEITGCACRTNRKMRTAYPEFNRHFAGRVIRDCPRIVIMRPVIYVVVVFADFVNFVFCFDIAMFGNADEDAQARRVFRGQIQSRIRNCFADAVDGD